MEKMKSFKEESKKQYKDLKEELRKQHSDLTEEQLNELTRKEIKKYALANETECECDWEETNKNRYGGINQKGGVSLSNIVNVAKIAVCAFLWGVISNNYYERLETFGPLISQLITENYQDVLTPYMSEMTNLQEALETIENRVNQGEGESEVQDEQGEQEVQGGESKDNSRQLSLFEVNGDIELRPDVIQRMNERHLNSETYIDDGITLELSYGTIAEYLGVGYFQAVLGNNNGIDIINQIETNITNAIQQDVVEIVKRRINSIRIEGQNTGNDDSGLSQLGNVVTDFFTMF